MNSIRTIHKVTGPTLTIDVPPDFSGKQVEVVIFPLEKEWALSFVQASANGRRSETISK